MPYHVMSNTVQVAGICPGRWMSGLSRALSGCASPPVDGLKEAMCVTVGQFYGAWPGPSAASIFRPPDLQGRVKWQQG